MISLESWLWFCVTEAMLCLTPGPAVLLVLSVALGQGARAGMSASLGILAANTGYFALSATSIGALLLASWDLFVLVKWLGAAYLMWLGAKALLTRANEPLPAGQVPVAARGRAFVHGLVTQGANPKTLVFFTALLPQFVDSAAPVAPQVAVLGVSSVAIELAVLALYVGLARRARGWSSRPGFALGFQRASGLLLMGAAAGLATLRRSS